MKVGEFVELLEDRDRIIIYKITRDILMGDLTSTLLDKRKRDLMDGDLSPFAERTIEYVEYTRWGKSCSMTLEDENNDE